MTLQEIFEKVKVENARSRAKYGEWSNYDDSEHKEAILDEVDEWVAAYCACNIDGEHGEVAELIQVANLCCRRIMHLTGEVGA